MMAFQSASPPTTRQSWRASSRLASWCSVTFRRRSMYLFSSIRFGPPPVARGIWSAKLNTPEVDGAIESLSDAQVSISWHHVRSHMGHFLNELADLSAKLALGAQSCIDAGLSSLQPLADEKLQTLIARHTAAAGGSTPGL